MRVGPVDQLPVGLLEDVLSYLPPEQIRIASYVSRKWHECAVRPLRAKLVRDGLTLPANGVRTWVGLQAHSERLGARWRAVQKPLRQDRPDFFPINHPPPTKVDDEAFSLCGNVALVRFCDQSIFVMLPPLGADGVPRFSVVKKNEEHIWCAAGDSGYVYQALQGPLQYFTAPDQDPVASEMLPEPILCAAANRTVLVTGHRKCLSVFSLPGLERQCILALALKTGEKVDELVVSQNGEWCAVKFWGVDGRVELWNLLKRERAFSVRGLGRPFLDENRGELLVATGSRGRRYDMAGAQLGHYSFIPESSGEIVLRTQVLQKERAKQKGFWTFGPRSGRVSETPARDFLPYLVPHGVASHDGRWFIGLSRQRKIGVWDMTA